MWSATTGSGSTSCSSRAATSALRHPTCRGGLASPAPVARRKPRVVDAGSAGVSPRNERDREPRVVDAVTDDETLRDPQPHVIGRDCPFANQQGASLDRARIICPDAIADKTEGETGIEDVLDDDDDSSGYVVLDVLRDLNRPRRFGSAPVGTGPDEVDLYRDGQFANEIGEEHERAGQDADHQRLFGWMIG